MKILEWVLAIFLGLVMLGAGVSRIISSETRSDLSDSIGVPGWFLILVSLLEILLAIDLFWPRFRILGGIGSAVVMVGALIFNLFGEEVGSANPQAGIPANIVLAIVGLAVAWLAAGRPSSIGELIDTARQQAMGQVAAVAETAADVID
jgi:uncharacterized membrane protein YphA (DoxX/SURF4 family)